MMGRGHSNFILAPEWRSSIRRLFRPLVAALLLPACGALAGATASDSGGTGGSSGDSVLADVGLGDSGPAGNDGVAAVAEAGGSSDLGSADDGGSPLPVPKPPMGWNSWNKFGCENVSETVIREMADALVDSGLAAVGYDTVTTDDCWSAATRDGAGDLQADPVKFPSGLLTGTAAAVAIDVSIAGATSVRLQTVAYETTASDDADWADARVTGAR